MEKTIDESATPKIRKLRLRYRARCCVCNSDLQRGTDAWWDSEAKTATCLICGSGPSLAERLAGTAGASGRQRHERLHSQREQKVKNKWGDAVGRLVLAFTDDPQSTRAWRTGSIGEERLAAFFGRELPDSAIALHDRRIPGSRANIDHVIVASSGVWVVDAKLYRGKVERQTVGPIWRREPAVFVAGRNRTKLIHGMSRQVNAVRDTLEADPLADEVVVRPVVCFVASDWRMFAKPFEISGVLVAWPQKLVERIATRGRLTPTAVARIANRLAVGLPAAGRS